jgi:hypothetical protein
MEPVRRDYIRREPRVKKLSLQRLLPDCPQEDRSGAETPRPASRAGPAVVSVAPEAYLGSSFWMIRR